MLFDLFLPKKKKKKKLSTLAQCNEEYLKDTKKLLGPGSFWNSTEAAAVIVPAVRSVSFTGLKMPVPHKSLKF